MSDLISRQDAIKAIEDLPNCYNGFSDTYDKACIIGTLEEVPSAEPERKKGKWLRYGEDGYPNEEDTVFWQCDQCLEKYTGRTTRIPNYCPNCGARMVRGEEE